MNSKSNEKSRFTLSSSIDNAEFFDYQWIMSCKDLFPAKWAAVIIAPVLGSVAAFGQGQVIYQQPQSQAAAVGYTTTFTGMITNTFRGSAQWLMDGEPIPGATNPPNYGLLTVSYSITNTQPTNAGLYSVVLSNATTFAVSSNASLTVINPYTAITMAGAAGAMGTNDGLGSAARFNLPRHVAHDANDNLYVTDYGNDTIRKITPAGTVSTFAGTPGVAGTNDGSISTALFNYPHGIALDNAGNIFLTDLSTNGSGGTVRKITPDGTVITIAGTQGVGGTTDGAGPEAQFRSPWGIAVDSQDNVFVSDFSTIRELTSPDGTNWTVTTIAGLPNINGYADGTNNKARFSYPDGLAVDASDNIFVADELNDRLRQVQPSGTNWITTTLTDAGFQLSALALDTNENIYIAGQQTASVFKFFYGTKWPAAEIAGNPGEFGTNNGTGITAKFYNPHGITLDNSGNLFVVDQLNDNVRKLWSSDASPSACLETPIVSGGQVQVGAIVSTGSPTNFTLLQADQLGNPWYTNTSAVFTTIIPGLNYQWTMPFENGSSEFFRLSQ